MPKPYHWRVSRAGKARGKRLRQLIDKKKPVSKGGRPSLYRSEFCELSTRYCLLGATNEELSESFGVTKETIQEWMLTKPEFKRAVHAGREGFDERVAASLGHRALGYSHPEEVLHFTKGGKVIRAKTRKQYPPDTAAASFWLRNRRPQNWKDRVEHTGEDGGPIDLTLNFVKGTVEKIAAPALSALEKKKK